MNYQNLIDACDSEWQAYTQHDFVQQLALGTLEQCCFLHYLKQDFLFLKHYARAYALAIYKAPTLAGMRQALTHVQVLLSQEMNHHIDYCAQWGISEQDIEAEPEGFGTVAYTRYVLDTGMSGDLVDLYTALAPCALGYAAIGEQLLAAPDTVIAGNPYAKWIQLYGGEAFQTNVSKGGDYFNQLLSDVAIDSQQGQRLIKVFRTATRMETAFWQQGLDMKQELN